MFRILAVKIHKAINDDRKDLYEATRGNWAAAIDKCNADTVNYVVGIYEGLVVSAYEPKIWYSVIKDGEDRERRRFDGTPVNRDLFKLFKSNEENIRNSFGRGQSIAYIEIDEKNKF